MKKYSRADLRTQKDLKMQMRISHLRAILDDP
jgi:hypothetical protein